MRKIGLLVVVLMLCAFAWSMRASLFYLSGVWALKEGRFELAVGLLTKTVRIEPEYIPAYDARGRAYWMLGQYNLASEDFESAIDGDPGYAAAYCHYGWMMLETEIGDKKKALFYLRKSIDFDPGYTTPFLILGQYYEQTGQRDMAEKYFKDAVSLTRERERARFMLEKHYLKRKRSSR